MLKICAVTGHRPMRFRFKYDERHTDCKRLKKRIRDQCMELYQKGVRQFWTGGAMGVDMWAGEILLRLKEAPEYQELQLFMALPFQGHDADWDERSRSRLQFLLTHCDGSVILGTASRISESYRRRNHYIVDRADILLAVYDQESKARSGTGMTVRYAARQGKPIILIRPDNGQLSSCNW